MINNVYCGMVSASICPDLTEIKPETELISNTSMPLSVADLMKYMIPSSESSLSFAVTFDGKIEINTINKC